MGSSINLTEYEILNGLDKKTVKEWGQPIVFNSEDTPLYDVFALDDDFSIKTL